MSRKRSLTVEDEQRLREMLQERDRLMSALGVLSVKELAYRFNVSRQTVVRYSYRLIGKHRAE